jgi:3'-phosphoadenosine 5'-phosphosulfate sulfotransferase (PAPS reductase)/FAD synthetase
MPDVLILATSVARAALVKVAASAKRAAKKRADLLKKVAATVVAMVSVNGGKSSTVMKTVAAAKKAKKAKAGLVVSRVARADLKRNALQDAPLTGLEMTGATLNATYRVVSSMVETVRTAVKAGRVAQGVECPVVTVSAKVPRCSTVLKTVTMKRAEAKKVEKAVKVAKATTLSAGMASVKFGKSVSATWTVLEKAKEKRQEEAGTHLSVL